MPKSLTGMDGTLEAIRQIRSAGRMNHQRTHSATTVGSIDDNASVSSNFNSATKRRGSKSPNVDYSGLRAAAGVSRMKHGRLRRGSVYPNDVNGVVDSSSAKGRRTSILTISDVGIKMRRRRRNTTESWGKNRTRGEIRYFDKHLSPIELFRRAVKIVQMCASLCQYKYEKENEGENLAHTVFTQYINENENNMEAELAFDASFFKANRKMRISAEVKMILSVHPEQRTEQQLAKVFFSLRSIQSFAEYPQRIQQKLVRVGWYETHQTKRAILRQGHIPQAFYFVLSGSAVVTVMEEHENFARTVHFLRRGDSFGELAILHDTRRKATVISREPIELLVISKEDFVDIFMLAGGNKNINDPDHKKFVHNIHFLKGWPVELMASNPKKCLFHFFRSGSVLVKDSNHSDWIYIIKSGSCQVLKKLREVKSCLIQHSDRVVGFENVKSQVPKALSRKRLERVRTKLSVVTLLLPKLHSKPGLITKESDDEADSGNEANSIDGSAIDHVAAAQKLTAAPEQSSSSKSAEEGSAKIGNLRIPSSPTARRKGVVSAPRTSEIINMDENLNNVKNSLDSRRTFSSGPAMVTVNHESDKDGCQAKKVSYLTLPGTQENKMPQEQRKTSSGRPLSLPSVEEEDHPSSVIILAIWFPIFLQTEVRITDADLHPMFVQVALLQKGDYFGVSSMIFDEQPSLSLVSNGAECIMISKKFFMNHCSDEIKRRLFVTEIPFPNDETLQKSLQDKVNWDAYRRKTLKTLVRQLPKNQRRIQNTMAHRRAKRDMSLGEDLKEAIKKMQRKDNDSC
ncbi:PREDICTED: uncharacterized protein LOC107356968 [Acropora digitifera]|uniref:uncharacterized protein LOC107356968 n=1 Tax=Acropora digitifera TaxID=70779 RepID=UPI00077A435A|nr:PREDICTED: uncharacterized protein LOC107356968 [Acropora digitifera]